MNATSVLVTGGAGFIGSHLCEQLLQHGWKLAVIDDLNDFYSPSLKRENLELIRKWGSLSVHRIDICDGPAVLSVLRREQPEVVVHLAARAGVRPSIDQPELYARVNILGTLSLLEACRLCRVSRFVFASSSSIYGAANKVPFAEDDPVNLPISPYAATKIAGEKLAFTYSHLYRIGVVCLRFFTVYGPRQRPDLAIRKFAERMEASQPIPVFGNGSAARDYTYVDDIVQGILASLNHCNTYDVFNLGNSYPVTLDCLIGTLESVLGRKARVQRLPEQPGDVPITFADISKARRLLRFSPGTSFDEGIRRFVEWMRSRPRETTTSRALTVSQPAS